VDAEEGIDDAAALHEVVHGEAEGRLEVDEEGDVVLGLDGAGGLGVVLVPVLEELVDDLLVEQEVDEVLRFLVACVSRGLPEMTSASRSLCSTYLFRKSEATSSTIIKGASGTARESRLSLIRAMRLCHSDSKMSESTKEAIFSALNAWSWLTL
jgi:hypothetical protein